MPYGVPRTLFKLDATGQAKEIALQDLYDAPEGVNAISIRGWTHDMFVLMCCMSGCDYAESVDGVRVKRAHELVGRYRDFDRVLRAKEEASETETTPDERVARAEQLSVLRKVITASVAITTSVISRCVSCSRVYGVKSGTTWKKRSSVDRVRAVYTSTPRTVGRAR